MSLTHHVLLDTPSKKHMLALSVVQCSLYRTVKTQSDSTVQSPHACHARQDHHPPPVQPSFVSGGDSGRKTTYFYIASMFTSTK